MMAAEPETTRSTEMTSALEMRNISKQFPGVKALDDVSFSCRTGEVHVLVGENGAGKSTLIKVLSGVHGADSGTLLIDGNKVHFTHPVDALQAGVSVIYQEFALLPERTVAQNIFLGWEPRRGLFIDNAAMRGATGQALSVFGVDHGITPDSRVLDLSVAQQQIVEIAKAISLDANVIVMDEPTAALDDTESEALFATIDRLRDRGTAIIYITHRMREVTRLADRVTVLKDGKVANSYDTLPRTEAIVHAMVGRDIGDFYPPPATDSEIREPVLSVRNGGNNRLTDINFELRAGEITGFAGVQGAGRQALAMALFGVEPFDRGTVLLDGEEVRFTNPRAAIRAGVTVLPGDRKAQGLLLMQSVRDNGMIATRALSGMFHSQDRGHLSANADMNDLFERVDVRSAGYDREIRFLSGGNQQKVIVARWLAMSPRVLIFIEPTRGIDVNAKAGIYQLMRELAQGGAAIMMVSSDLPEVLGAADRTYVMHEGTIVEEFPRGIGEADIMMAATGEKRQSA